MECYIVRNWEVHYQIKLKYTDSIVVSYKFSKTIGQSLFNYNKVLREISNEYSNTLVCNCKHNPDLAPFIYKPHGHVHTGNYIDDIITPNVENFLEIAKHIYPTEIPLEQTHNDSLYDTFLDLDITLVNNRFCFKVFHKVDIFDFEVISFPFLESNILQYICYNTFFLSWLDFLQFWICRMCSYNLSKITKTEL